MHQKILCILTFYVSMIETMAVKVILYALLLQKLWFIGQCAVTIRSLVRLQCKICEPKPDKCCIGNIILANYILTSAYCALSCQAVERNNKTLPVIQTFIHPRYKQFPKKSNVLDGYDVGLIRIDSYYKNKKSHLKLSGLETNSMIGMKAFFPVLNDGKPYLQGTLIQYCKNKYMKKYNICSRKTVCKRTYSACQPILGTPVFLAGRIIGIASKVDPKMCLLDQNIFTAIGFIIPWIKSVVKSTPGTLRRTPMPNKENLWKHESIKSANNLTSPNNLSLVFTPIWDGNDTISSSISTLGTKEQSELEEFTKSLRILISPTWYFPKPMSPSTRFTVQNTPTLTFSTLSKIAILGVETSTNPISTDHEPLSLISTTLSDNTSRTFTPVNPKSSKVVSNYVPATNINTTASLVGNVTEFNKTDAIVTTTETILPFRTLNSIISSDTALVDDKTDLMSWLNAMRSKLKTGKTPILVLTVTTEKQTTEFMDLT